MEIIKKVLRRVTKSYHDRKVIKYYKNPIKNLNNGPVLFFCQFESIWNKSENVFLNLKKLNCNAKLLVVKDKTKFDGNTTIFERKYPDDVILYEPNILEQIKPSLVMYSRPYDHYLPNDLRSFNVVKKYRTGFIPYYYALETDYKFTINDDFIRNIEYFFADQESTKKYFDTRRKKAVKNGYQHSYSYGYPALEDIILKIEDDSNKDNSIYKNKDRVNVMWTPRWTMDEKIGGSNFLKYYKELFGLFDNNSEYSFVFRPHPMLFDNFLEKNYISKEEYDSLMKQFKESENMVYDNTSEYFNTFKNTDILISDNSSIIIEYLLTGKPMIYCFNKSAFVFNDIMNELLDVNYVVDNLDDLMSVLKDLTNGIDPKLENRKRLVDRLKNENKASSERIAMLINEAIKN